MCISKMRKIKKEKKEKKKPKTSNMALSVIYSLLPILCMACYNNALDGDFVFDDSVTILKNKGVTTLPTNYTAIFRNDYWGTPLVNKDSHKSYRPLTTLMFHMEYAKYKFSPKQMKLMNLILHTFNTLLLNRLLNQFNFGSYSTHQIASLTSIIFAVHPIHTEAVSGIVGRADLMFCLLYLKALLVTSMRQQFSRVMEFLFVVIFSTIGILYKESAITIPLACMFVDYMKRKIIYKPFKEQKVHLKCWRNIGYILYTLASIAVRLWLQNFEGPIFKPMDNPVAFNECFLTRILSQNYLYIINIWIMIFPKWLSFDWALGCIDLVTHITDIRLQPVLLMYLLIFFSLFYYKKCFVILLAWGLLIIPFLPASGIITVGFVIAERVLYVPSIGYCLMLAFILVYLNQFLQKKPIQRTIFRSVGIFILFMFYLRTQERAAEWQKEETLYSSALAVCPNNAKVHYNIARLASDRNEKDVAFHHYHIAIKLYPEYEAALMNLGNLYRDKGEFKVAEKYLKASIRAFNEFPTAWMNLGIVQAALKKYDEALKSYRTALKQRNNYALCYYNLGNLYLEQNLDAKAIHYWQQSLRLDPKNSKTWANMLTMLDSKGLHEDALRMSKQALEVLPNNTNMMFLRANVLGKIENYVEAEALYLKAIQLEPTNSIYYSNLGVLYHRWEKLDSALSMYKKAIKLNPNDSKTAKENLAKILLRLGKVKYIKVQEGNDGK